MQHSDGSTFCCVDAATANPEGKASRVWTRWRSCDATIDPSADRATNRPRCSANAPQRRTPVAAVPRHERHGGRHRSRAKRRRVDRRGGQLLTRRPRRIDDRALAKLPAPSALQAGWSPREQARRSTLRRQAHYAGDRSCRASGLQGERTDHQPEPSCPPAGSRCMAVHRRSSLPSRTAIAGPAAPCPKSHMTTDPHMNPEYRRHARQLLHR